MCSAVRVPRLAGRCGWCGAALMAMLLAGAGPLGAQPAAGASSPAEVETRLFAVEIKVGPKWDGTRPPNEQAQFREHSATLKRLRDAGHIVVGARYADKGLLVFTARSAADVRTLMDADPSMAAGTFSYEVHDFNVFYPGTLPARGRR
jgi:uncharacterized protein YciI